MTPGGIITVVLGIWMLVDYAWGAFAHTLWLQIKLLLVLLLVVYHVYCWKLLQDFKTDRNSKSHVWFRWFNEFPVLLLIAIILLVVLRPV